MEQLKIKEYVPGQKWTDQEISVNVILQKIESSKNYYNGVINRKYNISTHDLSRAKKITQQEHKRGIITDKQAEQLKTEIMKEWQRQKQNAQAKGITLTDEILDKLEQKRAQPEAPNPYSPNINAVKAELSKQQPTTQTQSREDNRPTR